MYFDNFKLFVKKKIIRNSNKNNNNILPRYRCGIWHKMCLAHNKNNEKNQQITVVIELPNKENIRTLGENENYKYLKIFKADTIKTRRDERKKIKKEFLKGRRKLLES